MIHILQIVYSLPYLIGAVSGALLWKLYCKQKARWEDRYDPDGAPHYANHVSRVWVAGVIAVGGLGYVLLTAQTTQNRTLQLTDNVARCWRESYQSTKAQIDINRQNDLISRQQQGLQRDYDRATSDWLKDLVNPPGDLMNQSTNSPARQVWGLQRTAQYQTVLNDLGAKSDDLVKQRAQLDAERAQHPLPEATCGK